MGLGYAFSRLLFAFISLTVSTSFLDDVDRIATHDYEPSDDDIVRARLRTMGV